MIHEIVHRRVTVHAAKLEAQDNGGKNAFDILETNRIEKIQSRLPDKNFLKALRH